MNILTKKSKNWGKFVALPWSPNDITALIWSLLRPIVRSQKDWIPNQTLFSSQHGFLSVSKLSVQGCRFCSILCYVVRIYIIIILFLWLTLLHALCFLGSIICVPDLCYTLFLCYIQLPLCMAVLSSTQWQKIRKLVWSCFFCLWLFSLWVQFYWIARLFWGTVFVQKSQTTKGIKKKSLKNQADKTILQLKKHTNHYVNFLGRLCSKTIQLK